MRIRHVMILLALAAAWGLSLSLLRVIAPVLGPVMTAFSRVAVAALSLLLIALLLKNPWHGLHSHYKVIWMGIFSAALPFAFFSFAAKFLPAAYMAVINATSPMFGALLAYFLLGESLTIRKVMGMLLGVAGVGMLVGLSPVVNNWHTWLAVGSCLMAGLCYGYASVYTKKYLRDQPVFAMTTFSLCAAAVFWLPWAMAFTDFSQMVPLVSMKVLLAVLLLSLCCTSGPQMGYFKLLSEVGPTKALTVTFLIPLFGMAWGWVLLGEMIKPYTLLGAGVVLLSTALVLDIPWPKKWWPKSLLKA
jgi:drug/metabolite transporter (DMT)-like permease